MPSRFRVRLPMSVIAGGYAFGALFLLYAATAAPDLTFWDSAEFLTAAHTLGIPHPPGTPLFVLLAHVSAKLFSSLGPAKSVTMVSVIATAAAGGLSAAMFSRWIGALAAFATTVGTCATMTIWSNATETEVYSVSLLLSIAMLAVGERAGSEWTATADARDRWRALLVFLAGLAVPLHLSALVALPAAMAFAWRGPRPTVRDVATWLVIGMLALSAVAILPLLAARGPWLDSGHPATMQSLFAVLRREQFAVQGLWPRLAPLYLQLGNVFEWADWQFAFGLSPTAPPSLLRTPVTVLFALLCVGGLRSLWNESARAGRAMALLLACGTLGVAVWLNMRAGPSYGAPLLPATAIHEARERDYFFVLGFWAWGMLAGCGVASIVRSLRERVAQRAQSTWSERLPFALWSVMLMPIAFNAPAMNRTRVPESLLPRIYGRALLDAVPPNAVLFTAGDNDSFPLWYLQQVESLRTDVTIVTVPLLGAAYYRERAARRWRLLDTTDAVVWRGLDETLARMFDNAGRQRRPVRVSAMLAAGDRARLAPGLDWALQGVTYAPVAARRDPTDTIGATSGGTAAIRPPLFDRAAMHEQETRLPRAALDSVSPSIDFAPRHIQRLLRCSSIKSRADTLLVSVCNGT